MNYKGFLGIPLLGIVKNWQESEGSAMNYKGFLRELAGLAVLGKISKRDGSLCSVTPKPPTAY